MKIVVVTKIHKRDTYTAFNLYNGKTGDEEVFPEALYEEVELFKNVSTQRYQQRVFTLGEILILDENGREYGGHGRKPSKWFVEVTEVKSLEDAIKLLKTS